jgi:hypothetical protein
LLYTNKINSIVLVIAATAIRLNFIFDESILLLFMSGES